MRRAGMSIGMIACKILIASIAFLAAGPAFFSNLKKEADIKDDRFVIATFESRVNCLKCYQSKVILVNRLKKANKYDFDLFVFIKCNRKIEFKNIKKHSKWKGHLFMDKGSAKRKLGLKLKTDLAIVSSSGKTIIEFSLDELLQTKLCYKKALKAIEKHFKAKG
jgi:hypothetical protein